MQNTQALQLKSSATFAKLSKSGNWVYPAPFLNSKNKLGLSSTIFALLGKNGAGFTVIEMLVTFAIITALSAQILVSFSGLGQGVALNRAGQELARMIRSAQYTSIAVAHARVPVAGIPTFLIPPAVGIRIDKATGQRTIFAERDDHPAFLIFGNPDGKYTNSDEKIKTEELPDGITITRIIDQNGVDSYTAIHVLFFVPEAEVRITRDGGSPFPGNRADIELVNSVGNKKTVRVHITGQISVR